MPIAYTQEFDVSDDDRSTTNYDAVSELLQADGDPPAGLLVHTAGFGGGVFRIFDVWESEEHLARFKDERLMPAVMKVAGDHPTAGPPAREYSYELHNIIRG